MRPEIRFVLVVQFMTRMKPEDEKFAIPVGFSPTVRGPFFRSYDFFLQSESVKQGNLMKKNVLTDLPPARIQG